MFYDIGPFKIAYNMFLVWYDYGWDQAFCSPNDLFTGESCVGHYNPTLAARVYRRIKVKETGFAIGNKLTDHEIQNKAYLDYALDMGIIKQVDYGRINKVMAPACEIAIQLCDTNGKIAWPISGFVGTTIFNYIMSHAGDIKGSLHFKQWVPGGSFNWASL